MGHHGKGMEPGFVEGGCFQNEKCHLLSHLWTLQQVSKVQAGTRDRAGLARFVTVLPMLVVFLQFYNSTWGLPLTSTPQSPTPSSWLDPRLTLAP
jgi:hypothetical protein